MAIEKPPIRDIPVTGEILLSPRWEKYFFQTYDEVNLSYVHRHDENNPHKTSDANLIFNDITTNDVSITKHGFVPKAPNDATKFLDGTGFWDLVRDSDLSLSDIVTNDVSITKHGFAPRAPNDKGKVFRGDATYSTNIDYSSGNFQIGNVTGGHYIQVEPDGTLEFVGDATVWDDMRVVPGSFDRPGVSDPTIVAYAVGGGGTNSYLYQFAVDNLASFTCQLPHGYKAESNIYVHIHWTPGPNGAAESGKLVGWKIDYSWANINGNFGALATIDLSDACDGTDHKHQMTPEVAITGTGKGISSMLICNVKRTDTGTDDTWAGTLSGALPMLLEIDFHFEIDTVGSRQQSAK